MNTREFLDEIRRFTDDPRVRVAECPNGVCPADCIFREDSDLDFYNMTKMSEFTPCSYIKYATGGGTANGMGRVVKVYERFCPADGKTYGRLLVYEKNFPDSYKQLPEPMNCLIIWKKGKLTWYTHCTEEGGLIELRKRE